MSKHLTDLPDTLIEPRPGCTACKAGLPLETDVVTGLQFHVAQVGEDEYEQVPHNVKCLNRD